MALNLNGDDVITISGGGGGTSPSDPIQDAKITALENKTQNINSITTDGTKTTFDNKIISSEMETPLSTALKFRSSQYFDNIGDSGFFMGTGSTGTIQINKTTYQGTQDAIITLSANGTIQKTGSTCDASGNITALKFRSSQYFDNIGDSGFFMGTGSTGTIQINKTTYQGTQDAIMTLSANGTIQKTGSTCDASGNLTAIKFRSSQYYDSTGNSGFFMGVGATGTIQINKTPYQGTQDAIMTLSANGTIQKSGGLVDASGNITTTGNIQAPIISATSQLSTQTITNLDTTPVQAIGIAPVSGLITVYKDILPSVGNLLNFGANTAGGRFNEINGQLLISNQEVRCNKHYNENGSAGIDIGTGSTGAINLTGTKYQGNNNGIVTLNGSGQIQQPNNATIDGNGNATFKNIELLNISSSGEIKAKIIQSNDINNTLSLLNRSTTAGKGIIIDATTNGNIQLTGDSYINDPNRLIRLNTNGTIEKTPLICDGPTNNNLSGINTLSSTSIASGNILNSGNVVSPNFLLGTFGGGTGSAGTMNINSGNITNTGDITPITDNTEDIGTLTLAYKDIHIKGDVYKNGAIYGGGGGSISGISSVDNGGGDIEITFTGTDYKQAGYLTTDANGRIQVTPSIVLNNAEYDAIALKWTQERTNNNRQLVKIYLPQGVPVGQFNHTIHNVYILSIDLIASSKQLLDVRFIGYQGSTTIQEITLTNILNAVEIYNGSSTAHPNNIANPNLKQHIINHFRSDFDLYNYPGFVVTSVARVCVPSALVNNWTETDQFAVTWTENGASVIGNFHITSLLGSQNGYSNINTGSPSIPAGYTEIF
jgi:hypothetical protein